ncbi:MAG TPA: hypothetical protein DCM86_01345 [Verrucomicrobiales bacterium]|nr:hypothetical protein [Verrucomicrobiales bacterium]
MSHGQHFLDRFLEGYGWNGEHHHPPFEVAGLYVDQFPENDLARERSRRFGIPLASTIEEALTGGGSRLAVDGVVIVAEHGKYPDNEKGQRLYPRYPFFKRVVKVFEASGRSVPVFNDKHLSTDWDQCVEMVADSRRLGFPFLAGSSLPVTWRIPDMEVPIDTPLTESLCACYGGVDSYDFHGLETAQCVSERRRGGEVGIRSVQALKGARVWSLLREREIPRRLLFAALARSQTCRVPEGFTCLPPDLGWLESLCPEVIAYLIEHRDGFRTTMLLLNGLIQDFNYAGFEPRRNRIHSCQMYLPMPSSRSTLADFFNPLVNNIEIMLRTGKAPYPVERTLLTSGMTLGGVESLHRGQVPFETPGMEVLYRAPAESHHWRS